jgi:hypothetical protein
MGLKHPYIYRNTPSLQAFIEADGFGFDATDNSSAAPFDRNGLVSLLSDGTSGFASAAFVTLCGGGALTAATATGRIDSSPLPFNETAAA